MNGSMNIWIRMVIVTIGVLRLDIAGIQIPIKKVSIVEAVKVIFDHNSMNFLVFSFV